VTGKRFVVFFAALAGVALSVDASRKNEVTLVMVPREDGARKVGMDVSNRFPTLFLTYQVGANGVVSLHGWTGNEWVNISLNDFRDGAFFRAGPDSALIVEADGVPVPESLVPPASWCSSVYKITTTGTRPLLHLVGQYFDFKYKDWEWFAENYKLPIDAINPEGLNVSWYNKRLTDHFSSKPAKAVNDLQYWVAVRYPDPEVVAEAPAKEPVAMEADEEKPAMETPEDPAPVVLTNEVPAAVVLGADTADEAAVVEKPADSAATE
jgi:hypothetical protein